ncbi:unnamed protein product [Phaeothamnion confervicola]
MTVVFGFEVDVAVVMALILGGMAASLFLLARCMTPRRGPDAKPVWLAADNPAKRAWEVFMLRYAPFWIAGFAIIVALQLYEGFRELEYMVVCGGLALPILLLPFLYPPAAEVARPIAERFSLKANLWMAVYSFIGNYWYTHYFYSVLGARYTFPSWRLNDVPVPLYFATLFYFCTYHVASNAAIRRVITGYEHTAWRSMFLSGLVLSLAYLMAYMETLTISGFPHYSFADRDMAYVLGSAFYGIYFVVSFPMFYCLDERPSERGGSRGEASLWQAAVSSLGCGMLVLSLLDAVRLAVGVALVIPGGGDGGAT